MRLERTKKRLDRADYLLNNTELTIQQILNKVNLGRATFYKWYNENYSDEYKSKRKKVSYRNSKLGDKNPMKGKFLNQHHNWDGGEYIDKDGYVLTKKIPNWYEGNVRSNGYVLKHVIIACKKLGISKIPDGFVVHHKDEDKSNNIPGNLKVMSDSNHTKLHCARRCNDYSARK